MGRARRNQRDAIRKQRAKRRFRSSSKNGGRPGNDDDHRDSDIDLVNEEVRGGSVGILDGKSSSSSNKEKEGRREEGPPRKDLLADRTTVARAADHAAEAASVPAGVGTTNAKKGGPLDDSRDRIERMRTRRRLQKARRREKKDSREAAATVAAGAVVATAAAPRARG